MIKRLCSLHSVVEARRKIFKMLRSRARILIPALLVCILPCESKSVDKPRQTVRRFPGGFQFGTATAAYQVEGGWNADGKSPNIWDHLLHNNPCATDDCQNGDISNDSYNLYKRDVEMVRELGLDFYRFSLSWSRILPTSFPDEINAAGVQYYNNLIDELVKYNIQPMVTIYHWDLPQKLQDLGGWTNPYVVNWYSDYARVVYELFGDRVKHWITFNEPREICYQGYGTVTKAPQLNIQGIAEYMCAKNLLVAHAKAYHIYDQEFRASQAGTVGITLGSQWYEPENENHIEITEELRQFELGQYAHPIFSKSGDFPAVIKQKIASNSANQGFPRSRLPKLSSEEVEMIRGSSDFFGLNHYTTYLVYKNESLEGYYDVPSYFDDIGTITFQPSHWSGGASSWVKDVPWGFYNLLTKIREDYDNPTIFITENGYPTRGGLEDDARITYVRGYLDAMLDAIEEGSDIRAYSPWSLMDNFEWMRGYTERFGFYEVDYESPERTRTPRKSAFVFKEIVRSHTLDFHYEPDTTVLTIDEGH